MVMPLVLSAVFKGSEAFPFTKVTVGITNDLASKEDLTLHCKAKHDDRGEHTIKYGEYYTFKFTRNPIITVSLYYCSFRWQSDQNLHFINIYSQRRDRCVGCGWIVKEGGPCAYDFDTKTYDICYGWIPSLEDALAASNVTNANSTIEFHV
ncbi:S-protein-like protein 5-like [Senna tora]|uniref:S-protein homolog n=1 Tax=Senna tora TaxID=362788 RepID=A0A834W7G5_9FABA|nr:S-protein-like protein 5-like [Senna tora]